MSHINIHITHREGRADVETVTVTNRRGGIGKSTTAHALGTGLKLRGYSVLFVDMDSQGNLSYAMGVEPNHSLMGILTKTKPTRKAILHTVQGDIIPSGSDLATADMVLKNEYALRDALRGLEYDYIIIDTPAALGRLTANALTASDTVIIPAQAEVYSMQGINLLYELISAVKKNSNPNLSVKGVLLTRFNTRTNIARDMRENMELFADHLGTKLFKTVIRECSKISEAQFLRKNIFEYSPRSNAAKDYNQFIEEYLS